MRYASKARWSWIAVAPFIACDSFGATGGEVCREPPGDSMLSASAVNHRNAALAPSPGDTRRQERNLEILARPADAAVAYGFGHRYTMFNFDGIEPQTNAHLHTSYFPLHWFGGRGSRAPRISVAPALSGSSNVVGHPQEYRSDTLQWLWAVVARLPLSGQLTLHYGVCGDHRFGEYRVYPAVGLDWQPGPRWNLKLGLPDTRLEYRLGDRWYTTLGIAPDGNEWQVMNRERTRESRFIYEAYAVEWRIAWRALPGLTVDAGLGSHLHGRYELVLVDGGRRHLSSDTVLNAAVGLSLKF